MSETRFTPGPWFAGRLVMEDSDSDFGTVSVGPYPVNHKPSPAHYEDTICEVWLNPNIAEDAQDNANLIAAAPLMYAALQAVVATSPIEDSVLPMVLDALKQAEGEHP